MSRQPANRSIIFSRLPANNHSGLTFASQMGISPDSLQTARRRRAVARWLLLGVATLIIQILIGGITRLTGSGLSITEWKPILGAIPPMNEPEWNIAFEKYKGIAQYRYLNAHFSLSDFKGIYFWEWLHRNWARFGLAFVFAAGFIYFLVRKYFDRGMVIPLVILFLLGALQGLIGWIMVKSGLNDTDLYVSHFRLSVHFMAALLLLCYTLWFALKLLIPESERLSDKQLRNFTLITIAVLCLQLIYGAFMAGLKAAPVAPTWPDINGVWPPGDLSRYGDRQYEGIGAWTSHPVGVQFLHRSLAYLIGGLVIAWTIVAGRHASRSGRQSRLSTWRWWPALLVVAQIVLGILTVLNGDRTAPAGRVGSFELLALAHQLVATLLLMALIANLYLLRKGPASSGAPATLRAKSS